MYSLPINVNVSKRGRRRYANKLKIIESAIDDGADNSVVRSRSLEADLTATSIKDNRYLEYLSPEPALLSLFLLKLHILTE